MGVVTMLAPAPFLHLGNVGVVVECVGRRCRAQRGSADIDIEARAVLSRPLPGEKTRFLPLHPGTNAPQCRGGDEDGALFQPINNNRTESLEPALTPDAVHKFQSNACHSAVALCAL